MKTCSVISLTDLEMFDGFEWGSYVGVLIVCGVVCWFLVFWWLFFFLQLLLTRYSVVFYIHCEATHPLPFCPLFFLCSPLLSKVCVLFSLDLESYFLLIHAHVYSLVLLYLCFICCFSPVWVFFPFSMFCLPLCITLVPPCSLGVPPLLICLFSL